MAEGFKEFDPFKDYLGLCDIVKGIAKRHSEGAHSDEKSSVRCDFPQIPHGSYFGDDSELSIDRRDSKSDASGEVIHRKEMGVKNNIESRERTITTSTTAVTANPPDYSLTSRKDSAAHAFKRLQVCMCIIDFSVHR